MKLWKSVALATGLAGALGLTISLSPGLHAQSRVSRAQAAPRADVFTMVAGGGRIGVSVRDLEAEDLKGKVASGVAIESVENDSPASKAGLKSGDIVVEFDGERVRSVRQFTRLVSETPDGRSVATAVMRDGQRVTMNVTPESASRSWISSDGFRTTVPEVLRRFETVPMPARPAIPPSAPFERFFFSPGTAQLGIVGSDLEPQLAEYFGAKEGVLVSSVTSDSVAAKAGLKAGDVIVTVNGQAVDSLSDLRSRLRDNESGEFTLGILRDKKSMTLKGKLERPAERRRTTSRTIL